MEFAIKALDKSQHVLAAAKLIVVKTTEQANEAKLELDNIKSISKAIEENRKELVTPLNNQVSEINGAYKKPKEFLDAAEKIIKDALLGFTREQERLEAERQAKLEEAARKEREKLYAQAQKAEAKGKVEAADVLRETANLVVVPITQSTSKVAGISVRKLWNADVEDKAAFIKAALNRPDMMALILIDEVKLGKLAVALQGSLVMDGVVVYQKDSISSRANGTNPF